jgi:hypothetical protein
LLGNHRWRWADIDSSGRFVGSGLFQVGELAGQQTGRHEVAEASGQALGDGLLIARQVHEDLT